MRFFRLQVFTAMAIAALAAASLACNSPSQSGSSQTTTTTGGSAPTAESGGSPSTGTGSSETGALDPCAVLTQADAEAFFGGPSKEPTNTHTGDVVFQCHYRSDSGDSLGILIRRASSVEENTSSWDAAKANAAGHSQPITGVGEDGFFDTSINQFNIKQGVYWIILSGKGSTHTDLAADLTPIAQTVLSRLP